MRHARIDLGIEIEMSLDDLRVDKSGFGREHCALGRIKYPPATSGGKPEEGLLLYVKSSLTGDEHEIVNEYHQRNPDFPHESTADQFFDEGQFEAYRSLGFHVVESLFDPVDYGAEPEALDFAGFGRWFEYLEERLVPAKDRRSPEQQRATRDRSVGERK